MYFQFLIEDDSGRILVETLMDKLRAGHPDISCGYKSFHGLGTFTKRNTVKATKTGKLLNDLATYLPGFDKSLRHMGKEAAIFVVLDNDDMNTARFRSELEELARGKGVETDHVFCIAVEEIEAWLLGDEQALLRAYPKAKLATLHTYKQDSICGTWELLADVVYKGGYNRMMKENPSYPGIGKIKCEWAKNIGQYMDIHSNRSPSFKKFIRELEKRIALSA